MYIYIYTYVFSYTYMLAPLGPTFSECSSTSWCWKTHDPLLPRPVLFILLTLNFVFIEMKSLVAERLIVTEDCLLEHSSSCLCWVIPLKWKQHPSFLIELFFTQNPSFSRKLWVVLSFSNPVWCDSSVLIKVFLNKNCPFSMKPFLLIPPFLLKMKL